MLVVFPAKSFAQAHDEGFPPEGYSEILVQLYAPVAGGAELPAIVSEEGEVAYLPVDALLTLLGIPHTTSAGGDTVSGPGLGTALPPFILSQPGSVFWAGRKPLYLKRSDFLRSPDGRLFLASGAWGRTFGLDCVFRFRSLAVVLTTRLELPSMREARLAGARKSARVAGVAFVTPDTTLDCRAPMLAFGAADWNVMSTRLPTGGSDTRLGLAVGFSALHGDAIASIAWTKSRGFDPRQQYYLWRYVAPRESAVVRQVAVGKIFTPLTASIFAPVVGVQVTNTPPVQRRAFSTYTISNTTHPNWTVELYVNGVLIDYQTADSAGFYSFEVPLAYGATAIKLRFYGPYGEELVKEETIEIPYAFLPKGRLDYTLNAGIVEDGRNTRFARASAAYGLTGGLTLGGGVEHLSSIGPASVMPFLASSLRLRKNLLLSGEYALGVRRRGTVSWGTPNKAVLEGSYTVFERGQTTVLTNFIEERRVAVAAPLRAGRVALFSRLALSDMLLPGTRMRAAEWAVTGQVAGVATALSSYARLLPEAGGAYAYTHLSLGFRLPKSILLTPQLQYEYTSGRVASVRCLVEKPAFRTGFLNVAYEKNYRTGIDGFTVGFRYDCSFAQTALSAIGGKSGAGYVVTARGGLVYDAASGRLTPSPRGAVGRGGILLQPFLDMNCNGTRDAGEPAAPGFRFRGTGGRVTANEADTTIRIYDLEPYTAYLVQPEKGCFEHVAWEVKSRAIGVQVQPNRVMAVPIPVAVGGEVSGTVFFTPGTGGKKRGQGRIVVCLTDGAGTIVARTLSEDDGFFTFTGLPPGAYTATVECTQLDKLGLAADKTAVTVTIVPKYEGDVVSGVSFSLVGTGVVKAALR